MISSRISAGFRGRPGLGGLANGFGFVCPTEKSPARNDRDNVLKSGAEWTTLGRRFSINKSPSKLDLKNSYTKISFFDEKEENFQECRLKQFNTFHYGFGAII
jgi:hypothetical protein